ncbi:sterol carrier family protein [Mycolicibacterium celeriflavum]|uniref:sterol carrier family protein n=1 Tax=Mycolicibacterium celeriflavum TaxID=1249101 RepID=UPI003CEF66FA
MATARRARTADPVKTRAAVAALVDWLRDAAHPEPSRTELAEAVRLTARTLAAVAPGSSVEVRVPPFVAVQCIEGPAHRRGNPPNVVETDPRTWLLLAAGMTTVADAAASGALALSGSRASEIADWLPLVDPGPATFTESTGSPEPS